MFGIKGYRWQKVRGFRLFCFAISFWLWGEAVGLLISASSLRPLLAPTTQVVSVGGQTPNNLALGVLRCKNFVSLCLVMFLPQHSLNPD